MHVVQTYLRFDSPLLLLVCLSFLCTLAATPLLRGADSPPSSVPNRKFGVDGLRGILALSVFVHHAVIYHGYLQTGQWMFPDSHLFAVIGPLAVCMFFMVTGYLFFKQLLRKAGRPDWYALYVGRVFRIGPLYLLAALMMLLAVLAQGRFHLHESVPRVALEAMSWLGLGAMPWMPFNGNTFPDFWVAGVFWSIRYEWLFYLSLPLWAVLARRPRYGLPLIPIALVVLLARPAARNAAQGERPGSVLLCLFLVGMLCAWLGSERDDLAHDKGVWSALCVVLIGISLIPKEPYTWLPTVSLGVVFLLICRGCSLFGLLRLRPLRRLGDISYGLYLLQGLALALCFLPQPMRHFILSGSIPFWLTTCLSGGILLFAATAAHVYLERPAILVGKRIASRKRFIC